MHKHVYMCLKIFVFQFSAFVISLKGVKKSGNKITLSISIVLEYSLFYNIKINDRIIEIKVICLGIVYECMLWSLWLCCVLLPFFNYLENN